MLLVVIKHRIPGTNDLPVCAAENRGRVAIDIRTARRDIPAQTDNDPAEIAAAVFFKIDALSFL
jgi:hypothetical protein